MLDLGAIDVEEIATALADQSDYEHRWLLDPRTGRVALWTSDTGIDGKNPVESDELDLVPIDPIPSYVWYQDMADFAAGISDGRLGDVWPRRFRGPTGNASRSSTPRSTTICCARSSPPTSPRPQPYCAGHWPPLTSTSPDTQTRAASAPPPETQANATVLDPEFSRTRRRPSGPSHRRLGSRGRPGGGRAASWMARPSASPSSSSLLAC